VNGSVTVGASDRPALLDVEDGGRLVTTGPVTFTPESELRVWLGEGAAAVEAGGPASLGGTLSAVLPPASDPAVGTSWCVLQAGSIDGAAAFPVAVLPGLGADRYLDVTYVAGVQGGMKVLVTVQSVSGLGDLGDPMSEPVTGQPVDVVVADLGSSDGGPDGFDDIALVTAGAPGSAVVLINDGAGGVTQQISIAICDDPVAVTSGDFDADGRADLAFVSGTQDQMQALLNTGTTVADMTLTTAEATSFGPVDVAAIRMSGGVDGHELIVACAGDGSVQSDGSLYGQLDFFSYSGAGVRSTFAFDQTVPVAGKPGQVKPGSVGSGKGSRRAVGSLRGTNEVVVLSESGGVWSESQRVTVGAEPLDLVMQDVDGDGDDDVLVGNHGSNTVSLLTGEPDGTLGDQQVFEAGEGPQSLTLLDYDGDDDLDLALLSMGASGSTLVSLYRNDTVPADGIVTLSLEQSLDEGAAVSLLAAGQLHGDGGDDLVTVQGAAGVRSTASVSIRTADGGSPCQGDATGDGSVDINDILYVIGAWGTAEGDLDGDGDGDVDDLLVVISNFGTCG